MREFQRTDRLGATMRRELAMLLQDEVRDPRLGLLTLQDVRITRDLAHAKIYFTCLNGDPVATADLLNHSLAGFLRHGLARRIRVRILPELHFVYDHSVARGMHLSQLIEQATRDDHPDHLDS